MCEFNFRLVRSFIQRRANLVMSLADGAARGVDDAKDFERNMQAILSARPVSPRSPRLLGRSCHNSSEPRLSGCYCLCATPRRDGVPGETATATAAESVASAVEWFERRLVFVGHAYAAREWLQRPDG